MIATTEALGQTVNRRAACSALDVPRSTLYRSHVPRPEAIARPRPEPAGRRALSADEKATVRTTLNSPRFQDCAPREVYAALLEDDTYLCSVPTMYRILRETDEVRERRDQLRHPAYAKPELLATAPNQVWTWDGRPFGRLVKVSSDMTHHQGCASLPWRSKGPSTLGSVSFQGT